MEGVDSLADWESTKPDLMAAQFGDVHAAPSIRYSAANIFRPVRANTGVCQFNRLQQLSGADGKMKRDNMTREEELKAIIETIEEDLLNRPKPKEFQHDFIAEQMRETLNKARRELATLKFNGGIPQSPEG